MSSFAKLVVCCLLSEELGLFQAGEAAVRVAVYSLSNLAVVALANSCPWVGGAEGSF